jgi:hypothetical protein
LDAPAIYTRSWSLRRRFALVQLSDIHLVTKRENNHVLERQPHIAGAIREATQGISHGILIVSGDVAYSGKPEEYEFARIFLGAVLGEMKSHFGGNNVPLLLVPGNHDCDFARDNDIRKLIIRNLDSISDEFIVPCTAIQCPFHDFSGPISLSLAGTTPLDRLLTTHFVTLGAETLVFHLLNSAWVSRIHEQPGQMYFPDARIRDKLALAEPPHLVAAILHHPFNWYTPENGRALRKLLEQHTDIIITGHEHDPAMFQKSTGAGHINEYLEGGVLQDSSNDQNSSFNIIVFDTDAKSLTVSHFVWHTDKYRLQCDPITRPFERNRARLSQRLEFTTDFQRELDDPGATYTHPHKAELVLSDLCVYPDLKEIVNDSTRGMVVKG